MRITQIFIGFLLFICHIAESQQTSILWKDLTPGRYGVGFEVLYRYDNSRSWRSVTGETTRPVRISMWYPASVDGKNTRLKYEDYVFLKTSDPIFQAANDLLGKRNFNGIKDLMNNEAALHELMATPMAAVWKAKIAGGKFPVIAYSPGLNETWQHGNAVLFEYLASHGFIVISVPQLGRSFYWPPLRNTAVDLELQVRDLEFALGVSREMEGSSSEQSAVMGHSIGGIVALVLQMRNPMIDAVITLDSPYGWKSNKQWLTNSLYYRPKQMRAPLLDLRRQDERFDPSVFEAFKYSDRFVGILPGINHGDFTSFPMIAGNFPVNIIGRTPEAAVNGYQAVCRSVLAFLQGTIQQNRDALSLLTRGGSWTEDILRIQRFEAKQPPPSEEDFVRVIKKEGYDSAKKLFRLWKTREPDEEILGESEMTSIGYDLLAQKEFDPAISVLRLILLEHPVSANAHDSVAEAYMLSGDKKMASEWYQKVIEVIDKDPEATPELRDSLKENALSKLKELNSN